MFTARRVDGAKLRALREDAGLTLQALADKIAAIEGRTQGASPGYLSRIERGKDVMSAGREAYEREMSQGTRENA